MVDLLTHDNITKLQGFWNNAFKAGIAKGGLEGWQDYCIEHIPFCTKKDDAIFTWLDEQPALEVPNGEDLQHFLHQVGRIPRHEPANLLRVVQVAYNLGQLEREGKCTFPKHFDAYIKI